MCSSIPHLGKIKTKFDNSSVEEISITDSILSIDHVGCNSFVLRSKMAWGVLDVSQAHCRLRIDGPWCNLVKLCVLEDGLYIYTHFICPREWIKSERLTGHFCDNSLVSYCKANLPMN